MLFYYPKIASHIKDEETKNLALYLDDGSDKHTNVVIRAMVSLGRIPRWSTESFEYDDIIGAFQRQSKKRSCHYSYTRNV